jgi:LPS-assembly lipoprotein
MAAMPGRRALMASMAAAALLAGCGFQLRGTTELPFSRIALEGFAPRSPLTEELRRALSQSAEVVATPAQAQVVLYALSARRERGVVAQTTASQVRELQLRVRLEFKLTTPGGRELIPATELLQARDMSYSETVALAKEYEEAQLLRAMESEIVGQLMRRLARVKGVNA